MDFVIATDDLDSALEQILQGRKDTVGEVVDLTADRATLTVVATGRSIEVPIEAEAIGSAIVPIKVIFGAKRMSVSSRMSIFACVSAMVSFAFRIRRFPIRALP